MPALTPLMSASIVTFVPGFQYDFGRQWTSWLPYQCQLPFCLGTVVMCRFFSNDFLSLTGVSKRTMAGMPTPTLLPFSG